MEHLDTAALENGLAHVRAAPRDDGELRLIVARPAVGEREELDSGELNTADGLVGDTWAARGSRRTEDGGAHPDMQLNIINARVIELLARTPQRWSLAGDQLYLDLDLSDENLPPWTRMSIGSAVIEITDQPHTGCAKFRERFGPDAFRWVNSEVGRALNLRGVNAKVIQGGAISIGDKAIRL